MRLTLRTLLAYLDNTLQPADVEKLRQKLSDSGFATTLVRRIRATLAQPELSAPSPDAIGPIEDANLTSEYLDSTLPPEQIVEIERAALDSDSQLAETAACHQILTMVLGRPANVSSELRDRIHRLPERELGEISDGLADPTSEASFSALTMDAEAPTTKLPSSTKLVDESLGNKADSDGILTAPAGRAIEPVGKTDSGVTDAPSRLQQHAATPAGGRPTRIDEGLIGSGPSRMRQVLPLLVSLGVCAVLLFALSRVFQPLLSGEVAMEDSADATMSEVLDQSSPAEPAAELAELIPPPVPEAPIAELPAGELPTGELAARGLPAASSSGMMPAPDSAGIASDSIGEMNGTSDLMAPLPTATTVDLASEAMPAPAPAGSTEPMPAMDATEVVGEPMPGDIASADPMEADSVDSVSADGTPDPPMEDPTVPPGKSLDARSPTEVDRLDVAGKLVGPPTLLMRLADRQWQRLKTDEGIISDQFIVAAPTFRTTISVANRFDVTLIGPAAGRLIKDQGLTIVRIDFGRAVINAKAEAVDIPVLLGNQLIGLNLDNPKTTAAVSVTHRRLPGSDPLDGSNRTTQISLLVVEGKVDSAQEGPLSSRDEETKTLTAGQGWTRIDAGDYEDLTLKQMPPWVIPVDEKTDQSLEATARNGLLALLPEDHPFEQSLREATLFRRAEVVELAAETLLAIGQAETYFGGDGILNDPKQRIYWSKHFEALVTTINRNPVFANAVLSDAARMDSANANAITKLLTGYSQSDLENGGDRELVQMLQDPSMTIRALAIANLKAITGTTLLYRADYDTEARRKAGVKKWAARLGKNDIRWPQKNRGLPARPGAPTETRADDQPTKMPAISTEKSKQEPVPAEPPGSGDGPDPAE